MKLSTGWRADKMRKNRARATRKPKIRWEVLGLPNPLDTSLTTSMEDIRRQVSNMASRGFGQGTRSRTAERVHQRYTGRVRTGFVVQRIGDVAAIGSLKAVGHCSNPIED